MEATTRSRFTNIVLIEPTVPIVLQLLQRITYTWILENIAKNLPFNLYALRFDLTFPHEFDETSEEKIRAMVSRFMLELRGNDEGYDPDEEVAYLYVIHRFGSNDNIFNRHLNVHIYALNAVIVKGKFKRTRPWSNEERAKGIWGFILQEELGWTEFVEKNPDLRVQYIPFFKVNDKQGRPLEKPYATMAGKHLLTLRYMYRYPVIDVYKSFVKNGERGYRGGAERPPFMFNTSAVQSSDVREVLESHHRLTWCGYLSSKRKTEVVSLLMEKPIPLSQIIDKLPHKLCPKCNSPLIQEKFRDWRMTEGHSEEEDAAAYLQENDWGELERDRTGIKESTDLEESTLQQWKTSDAWEKELSHKARLARLNGW